MYKSSASYEDWHRNWRYPGSSRRRWLEPFVLLLIAEGRVYGYGILAGLEAMGVSGRTLDIGQVYRVLRNLELEGSLTSVWNTGGAGPARHEYRLTDTGWSVLRQWAAVMDERQRLSIEFLGRYAASVPQPAPA